MIPRRGSRVKDVPADPLAQAALILNRAGQRHTRQRQLAQLLLALSGIVVITIICRLFLAPNVIDYVLFGVLALILPAGVVAAVNGDLFRGQRQFTSAYTDGSGRARDADELRDQLSDLLTMQIAAIGAGLGLLGIWLFLTLTYSAQAPRGVYVMVLLPVALLCLAGAWWARRARRNTLQRLMTLEGGY